MSSVPVDSDGNEIQYRVIFASNLQKGDVMLNHCSSDYGCQTMARTHKRGTWHQATVLAIDIDSDIITGVIVNENGDQHSIGQGKSTTVYVALPSTQPSETPES